MDSGGSVKSRAEQIFDDLTESDETWGKLEDLYNIGKSKDQITKTKIIFRNDSQESLDNNEYLEPKSHNFRTFSSKGSV
jgi:hypothetical protein